MTYITRSITFYLATAICEFVDSDSMKANPLLSAATGTLYPAGSFARDRVADGGDAGPPRPASRTFPVPDIAVYGAAQAMRNSPQPQILFMYP